MNGVCNATGLLSGVVRVRPGWNSAIDRLFQSSSLVQCDSTAPGTTEAAPSLNFPNQPTTLRSDLKMWLEKNLAALTLLAILAPSAWAWGGLFNRFSPEMLSNLGYGGHGGFGGYRAQPFLQRYETPEEILQELEEAEEPEEPCYGKKCTANEHCCPGSVCVYADGLMGTCLFMYGLKQGEICHRTNDCEKGLLCQDTGDTRTCQPPLDNKKQYSENCLTSSECDISKGLCCQLQRRHRQAPRKVCSYFKDPLVCSGPVATDQIINQIEHTAGEKRLTGKLNHFNHIRK